MKISTVKYLKGFVGYNEILVDELPKYAFIGRSNAGKSSLINAITNSSISKSSSKPGSTQILNVFLLNNSIHLIDLPGYGYARGSKSGKDKISNIIEDYLFDKQYHQNKIVLIVDAMVGMTDKDISMFNELKDAKKDFLIAASKIDRTNQSELQKNLNQIKKTVGAEFPVYPFSSKTKKGIDKLVDAIFE